MARRQSEDDDGNSLDSLLDTMTNVVGILVIVLVVTQLGVGDAVQRISESDAVDPEALAAAKAKLDEIRVRETDLKTELAAIKPVDKKLIATDIAATKQNISIQEALLAKLLADQDMLNKQNEQAGKLAEESEAKTKANMEELAKMKAAVSSELNALAQKKAILAQTPERTVLAAKVVSLPNPRPAPEGSEAVHFVAKNNKIYFLNIKPIQELARKKADFIVKSKRLDANPEKGIDPKIFVDLFNERPLPNVPMVDVEMVARGRYPRLVLKPRDKDGFTVAEVEGLRSTFAQTVSRTDKSKYYGRFYVLPDSFDVYVSARAAMAKKEMLAGWEPQPEDWNYSVGLGGPIRLGPPPPPPKPLPPGTKPPPPKPPAKPPNVID